MAGQNLARDEAGNIWELDAQGNAVRLHTQSAPRDGGIFTLPKEPEQVHSTIDYIVNPDGSVTPRKGGPKDPNASPDEQMPGDPTKEGKAYYDSLPPLMQQKVKQLLSNHIVLSSFALGKPQWAAAIAAASHIDPTYDPSLAAPRAAALKEFTGTGKGSVAVGAVNRLASNLAELKSISDKMGGPNLGIAPVNKLIASVQQQGMPALRARYDALVPEIANQFDLIMKSNKGTPTVSGIQDVKGSLDRARSLDERNGAFQEIVRAVHGAIAPIKDEWDAAYGGTKAPPMWVSKEAGDFFSKVDPEHADTYGGNDWRGLPGLKGDALPWQMTPFGGSSPPPPPSGTSPGSGTAPPGGSPATGPTQTRYFQSGTDKQIAGMLAGGAPAAQIKKFAADNGGGYPNLDAALAWRALHPTYRGGYDVSTQKIVPTTMLNRAAASPVAAGIMGAADAGTAGLADEGIGAINALKNGGSLSDNIAAADLAKQTLLNANPGSALAGNVIGGTTAMLGGGLAARGALEGSAFGRGLLGFAARNPIKAGALGDAAYGAAYGAGENNDNRALGAGVGGATGLVASPVGAGATKFFGGVLKGVTNPAVQRLRALGIPLTAGEVLGGGFKKAQDAATSIFGPGDMIARRYADGRKAVNQAAFNIGGQPIGADVNAVGQQGIDALKNANGQFYSNTLDPVTLNLGDPQFAKDIAAIRATAQGIPNDEGASDAAQNALTYRIGNGMDPATGDMSGRNFQEAYRGLARTGRERANKAYGFEVGGIMRDAQNALASTLEAQSPGTYGDFLKANATNRNLSVLSGAVNAAKNQVSDAGDVLFTPAQLGTAASANARNYGGLTAAASGQRPFNQLALDSQQVMSSRLPESGTAVRALAMKVLGTGAALGGAGGLGYGAGGQEGAELGGLGVLGGSTLLGTRAGQQLLTAALIKRTLADQATGRMLQRNPQVGASILAAAGIPLLAAPSN